MSEYTWLSIFADNLSWLIRYKNMSRDELCKYSNIDKGAISRIINKRRLPNVFTLINLAEALDEDLDEFLYFDDVII